jgi:hypothetical protein
MHKLQEDYKREMEQILKASTNFMTKSGEQSTLSYFSFFFKKNVT